MGTLQNPTPSSYPSRNPNSISQPNLSPNPKSPSFDEVSNLFSLPLSDAADSLGVCTTVLKKVCYDNGLVRWPYRKFLSGKSIEEIKEDAAMEKDKQSDKLTKIVGEKSEALASSALSSSSDSQPQNKSSSSSLETSASQQQPSKDAQIESSHEHGSNSTKANAAVVDEFKYGFPSNGLSGITYKWWENKSNVADSQQSGSEDAKERKQQPNKLVDAAANLSPIDGEISEGKINETEADSQWTSLLSALRKRAVTDGQQALKLGVYKGYGVQKLDRTKKMVLVQIFKSSLPGEWGDLSFES